jgi:membrane associated rhomboid family serine protease
LLHELIQRSRGGTPFLTLGLLALTLSVSVAGLSHPVIVRDLERNAVAIAAGQWWRLVTSWLVHDHWWQLSLNCLLLVLFGFETEHLFSRFQAFSVYLTGGIAGEIAGCFWQPVGAGNSVAVCGLLGGLLVAGLAGAVPALWIARIAGLYMMVALTGEAAFGFAGAIVLCAALVLVLIVFQMRGRSPFRDSLAFEVIALIAAVVLAALQDIHGVATLAGACAGWFMKRRRECAKSG